VGEKCSRIRKRISFGRFRRETLRGWGLGKENESGQNPASAFRRLVRTTKHFRW
jgi:hypothetical protein